MKWVLALGWAFDSLYGVDLRPVLLVEARIRRQCEKGCCQARVRGAYRLDLSDHRWQVHLVAMDTLRPVGDRHQMLDYVARAVLGPLEDRQQEERLYAMEIQHPVVDRRQMRQYAAHVLGLHCLMAIRMADFLDAHVT